MFVSVAEESFKKELICIVIALLAMIEYGVVIYVELVKKYLKILVIFIILVNYEVKH